MSAGDRGSTWPIRIFNQLLLIAAVAVTCLSQTGPTDESLLKQIDAVPKIRSANLPFQLEAAFVVHLTTDQTGHIVWKWSAKDLWSQEVSIGAYRDVQVRKGDSLFIARNISFRPLHMNELVTLLDVASLGDGWDIKKTRQSHSAEGECMELRSNLPGNRGWKRQVCIDPTTKDLLSDELKSDTELRRKDFSDYQPYGSHRYPHHLKLVVDGSAVLKVGVTSLREESFDSSAFVIPAGAVVRRECENKIPPVALKTPDPTYPASALKDHFSGSSVVSITIMPDGTVDNVHLIGSSTQDMDAAVQQIVNTWKFKPALCGNEPVAMDAEVTINFRLR